MVKEAEAHKQDDAKRKEEVEAKNQADQLIYSTEKLLQDNAGKLSEAGRAEGPRGRRRAEEGQGLRELGGHPEGHRRPQPGHPQAGRGHVRPGPRRRGPDPAPCPRPARREPRQGGEEGGEVIDAEFEDVK